MYRKHKGQGKRTNEVNTPTVKNLDNKYGDKWHHVSMGNSSHPLTPIARFACTIHIPKNYGPIETALKYLSGRLFR